MGHDTDAASGLLQRAMEHSTIAFSNMVNEKVTLTSFTANLSDYQNINYAMGLKFTAPYFLLITPLKGELTGKSLLVISPEEANKLFKSFLHQEPPQDLSMLSEMQRAVLLELDNILSASVVTELANALNKKVYGDVPELKIIEGDITELMKVFFQDTFHHPVYEINASFETSSNRIALHFVWLFNQDFFNALKDSSVHR